MKLSVIGAGAWGTALGLAARRAGNEVMLWSVDEEAMQEINTFHTTPYLPNIPIPKGLEATSDLSEAVAIADAFLMVVPAQVIGKVCEQMRELLVAKDKPLIICCKGIEQNTHRLMSEVITNHLLGSPIAVISGPNFADEIAKGFPAATTLACGDEALGMSLLESIGSSTFRTYYSPDIIGAQLGGAVKNVLAIACGIAVGKGFGENTKVAIVTRGINEISRLCEAKGGKIETLLGLSGMGDMMLTCGTPKSRNMSFGKQLGEGKSIDSILAQEKTVEGYATALSVFELGQKLGVEMPICEAVKTILYDRKPVDDVIEGLLSRPLTAE